MSCPCYLNNFPLELTRCCEANFGFETLTKPQGEGSAAWAVALQFVSKCTSTMALTVPIWQLPTLSTPYHRIRPHAWGEKQISVASTIQPAKWLFSHKFLAMLVDSDVVTWKPTKPLWQFVTWDWWWFAQTKWIQMVVFACTVWTPLNIGVFRWNGKCLCTPITPQLEQTCLQSNTHTEMVDSSLHIIGKDKNNANNGYPMRMRKLHQTLSHWETLLSHHVKLRLSPWSTTLLELLIHQK